MQLYMHYLQKRHAQRILQKKIEIGDLVLLSDEPTARGQYPLARVIETFPKTDGVVRRVRVMTANTNKLNSDLPCTRTTLDRDSNKIALVEFPSINPISEHFHLESINNDNLVRTGLWGSAPSYIPTWLRPESTDLLVENAR